ncbi:LysM domain-containing protein [Octadecabacter temperatus]|uniref:LysM domain/BON superfamily protein n=1 Tax=Octadecabacter temperatus TaxID=1458307 RepID=A0A0K0Y197_9RHOB|nr:LysM peptidoglycan-binding domain-containing protein [Octadecabacter temperatus]AKS44687.1 LysM domain/BON superfamily protein [Octadecabacter temperatus]SIO36480.1 LysM domain-containing protein [Octadecabacter temperatus]
MIRTTVAMFLFALIICGLIIFRPFTEGEEVAGDRLGTPIEAGVEVTRAATPDLAALTEAAVAVAPLTTDPATGLVEAPRRIDVARPNTDDTRLSDMTNNVLAELGFAGVETVTTNSQAQRESTSDILAGIEAATGHRSVLEESDTLEAIVIAALQAGETDESIDMIVNAAAAAGTVAVPEILVTSDGRVDTHVLLNNIVTQAQIASGGEAPEIPEVSPDNTAGMEIRVVQRATDDVEARFYTVQSGDSLGAISIKFFGSIEHFETIFEANKGLLSSPDRIRVGQRLVIPQLDA